LVQTGEPQPGLLTGMIPISARGSRLVGAVGFNWLLSALSAVAAAAAVVVVVVVVPAAVPAAVMAWRGSARASATVQLA